ncbi:MAG: hypothetical protein IJU35_01480 [Paludibacteraceae bacterium]|nr:hypothetical protein [Paludibacteraceae bacterium]
MIKIPYGNEIKVLFPVYHDGDRIDAATLDNIQVTYGIGDNQQPAPFTIEQDCIAVMLPPDLPVGNYDFHITADYLIDDLPEGQVDCYTVKVASHLRSAVRIVKWNDQSDFVPGNPVFADKTYFASNAAGVILYTVQQQQDTIQSQQRAILNLSQRQSAGQNNNTEVLNAINNAKNNIIAALPDTSPLATASQVEQLNALIGYTINQIDNA